MKNTFENTPPILVTGGAGYIGSHMVAQLIDHGAKVIVLDNFYSGHRWAVHPRAHLIEGNVSDSEKIARLIQDHKVESVIHFAAHIEVAESVSDPIKYYQNNTANTLQFLKVLTENRVKNLIFSSTAAVYGEPKTLPVSEVSEVAPINPYGWSKFFSEQIIRDVCASQSTLKAIILRYFNVAGARVDGTLGQATPRATHLIKVACETASGLRPSMQVYGTDYPTADGTCVRDYIHVDDLCSAHLLALQALMAGASSNLYNCGYGHGFSVKEVLETVQKVSAKTIPYTTAPRRAGDSPAIVADSQKIRRELGWKPEHDNLELICKTAYDWERKLQEKKARA